MQMQLLHMQHMQDNSLHAIPNEMVHKNGFQSRLQHPNMQPSNIRPASVQDSAYSQMYPKPSVVQGYQKTFPHAVNGMRAFLNQNEAMQSCINLYNNSTNPKDIAVRPRSISGGEYPTPQEYYHHQQRQVPKRPSPRNGRAVGHQSMMVPPAEFQIPEACGVMTTSPVHVHQGHGVHEVGHLVDSSNGKVRDVSTELIVVNKSLT